MTDLSFTRGSVILHWTDPTPVDYANPSSWSNPVTGGTNRQAEIGFRVERALDPAGPWTFVANALANSTTYTDNPPDPTATYYYRVTTFNQAASAAPSNVIMVEGLPPAPTGLTATVVPNNALLAGSQVALAWTNVSTTATTVEVERAVGVGPFTLLATVTPAPAGPATYTDTSVAAAGPYSYQVRAVNVVGPSAYSNIATVTVPLAASSTVLSSSANPSVYGQNVTFTATVSSPQASATPGGTVEFFDGLTSLGTGTMTAGVASFSIDTLGGGSHAITAKYSGDAIFAPSAATGAQLVNQASTSVGLITSGSPSVNGDLVTFTATVSAVGGFGTPTGDVEFFDGTGSLGVVTLAGNSAGFSTATLAVGTHPITAVYLGDLNFAGSTSPVVNQVVDPGTVSVGLSTSGTPTVFGSNVTFTASVAATGGAGTPVGSVQFLDGGVTFGSSPLVSGVASFSTTSLAVGSHDITAVFISGDVNFTNTTSSIVTQVVNPNTTSTVVASSGSPTLYGVQVTFTATVSPSTAGGTVEFFDGVTSLGTSSLAGGIATFQTASLSVGSHSITGVYSGDATFVGSTSAAVTQVVSKGTTATALSSTLNPSVEGSSVTFTATVSPVTGVGLQSGTVQFFDGAVSLGSPALSGGQASVTLSTLAAGVHSITAVYSGDANFAGSTSTPALSQNVLRTTSTVVTSNRVPSANLGQNITFTATVRPVTGTGIPTGTVSFNIDGTINSPVLTLNLQGRATFQIATLSAGSHNVIATYGATAVFAGSTSATFVQVVNQAATTTTMTSNVNPSVFGRSVTLTARVQPNPGAGTNVEFFEGLTSLGSFPLDTTGRARLPISTLSVGTHGITAVFPGTVNYADEHESCVQPDGEQGQHQDGRDDQWNPGSWNTTVVVHRYGHGRGTRSGRPHGNRPVPRSVV